MVRKKSRHANREEELSEDKHPLSHPHFFDRTEDELTFDERCSIALESLCIALHRKILSQRNAEVARLALEAGLSGREIARTLGISPSAVSQQLKHITAQLSLLKDEVEIKQP
jgi:DNA-binding CsgD family transcriptional regulator